MLGQDAGGIGQQAVAIERLHFDPGDEHTAPVLVPLDLDQALALVAR